MPHFSAAWWHSPGVFPLVINRNKHFRSVKRRYLTWNLSVHIIYPTACLPSRWLSHPLPNIIGFQYLQYYLSPLASLSLSPSPCVPPAPYLPSSLHTSFSSRFDTIGYTIQGAVLMNHVTDKLFRHTSQVMDRCGARVFISKCSIPVHTWLNGA